MSSLNKKALDYAMLLWVVVAIAVLLLYVGLQSRITRVGTIGEVEIPIMRTQAEKDFLINYVTEAARLSMPATQKTEACAFANTKDRPTMLTLQLNVSDSKTKEFNKKMDEYLTAYATKTKQDIPLTNYELYITKGEIAGIAIEPVIMPLKDFTGQTIGAFTFKPNFKIKYDHKLEEYPQIKTILEMIAKECSDIEKPEDCVAKRMPTSWSVTKKDDEYTFIINLGKTQPCYILYLPEKTTTPTI